MALGMMGDGPGGLAVATHVVGMDVAQAEAGVVHGHMAMVCGMWGVDEQGDGVHWPWDGARVLGMMTCPLALEL